MAELTNIELKLQADNALHYLELCGRGDAIAAVRRYIYELEMQGKRSTTKIKELEDDAYGEDGPGLGRG